MPRVSNKQRQKLIAGQPNMSQRTLGILKYNGQKIQCGICGKWYILLALHIIRTHGWSLNDYRVEFSLNRSQPLCTPEFSKKCGDHLIERGLRGRNLWKTQPLKTIGTTTRMQGRIAESSAAKGTKRAMNPLKFIAQRSNLEKAKIAINITCFLCGKIFKGLLQHKRQRNYCPDCRPLARKIYWATWRRNNREKCRTYYAKYHAKVKLRKTDKKDGTYKT